MIILEGPDGAGKSTLADSLARELDLNILKMTINGGQSATEYLQKLQCDGVVMDRCWISEQIYSDIFGREPRLDADKCEWLTDVCADSNIPIVIVLPPLQLVIARLIKRGDEHEEVIDNIEEIYRRYVDWVDNHDGQCVVVDDSDVETCKSEVLKCML